MHEEDRPPKIPSNDALPADWKTCPICEQGDAKSPQFKHFLPRIRHLIEHKTGFPIQGVLIPPFELDELCKHLGVERPALSSRDRKAMIIKEVRPFLPSIADWLEESLTLLANLASIRQPGIATADELRQLAGSLPTQFKEQRDYILQNEKTLRETGQDTKWPPRVGAQAKFVSESMAGAEFGLAPATSREYIRREKPRARPARDKRKSYERRSKGNDGRVSTNKSYE